MVRDGSGGNAPPVVRLDGLTEIRVHGVGGTSPESMLADLQPTRVAGDRVAGFYRTSDARARHREAYSWGGLTSRSPVRALWAFLLPAMLANMAGWMAQRFLTSGRQENEHAPTTRTFRWAARCAALALTVTTAVMVSMAALDLLAYQCGRAGTCRAWWPAWFDALAPASRPGQRLALGAVVPLLVLVGFSYLARQSRSAYERIEPPTPISAEPGAVDVVSSAADPHPSRRCAAALEGGLRNENFWSGLRWHVFLSQVHLASGIAVVGAVLAAGVVGLDPGAPSASLGRVALVGAAACLVAVVVMLVKDVGTPVLPTVVSIVALTATAMAAVAALQIPAGNEGPVGVLPGIEAAVAALWKVSLALFVPLVVQQSCAWVSRRYRAFRAGSSTRIGVFPWAGPFVMNSTAIVTANAVLLSLILWGAERLGDVRWASGPQPGEASDGVIYVPQGVATVAAGTSLGLVVALVGFGIGFGLALLVARSRNAEDVETRLKAAYQTAGVHAVAQRVRPRTEAAWWRSAFDPPLFGATRPERAGKPTRWVRKVAAMEFVGAHSRAVAIPFIAIAVGWAAATTALVLDPAAGVRGLPPQLVQVGTSLGALILPAWIAVLVVAWRNPRWRRVLGSLFDVGTFFPRSFHPFAPPAYAERAVPELTRRIWRLHDNHGRVVLTAHSQGSVIAAAALGRRSDERRATEPAIGLVTFGSPLGKLYRWAFPALFSDGFLSGISRGRAGIGPVVWRNVHYATDYIGGPLATEGSTVDDGIERPIVDPPTDRYVVDQPLPRVVSHTGYWLDEALWAEVNRVCDLVAASPRIDEDGAPSGSFRTGDPRFTETVALDPNCPVVYR